MGQNLASVHFDATRWGEIDTTIDLLEELWEPMLVVLGPDVRRRTVKMGDGSEPFCRNAHVAMRKSRSRMPSDLDVDEMGRDLASHDALAERRIRIARLMEKLADTDVALGSDVMVAALQGYAQLKLGGQADALEGLRRNLGKRFEKAPRKKAEPAANDAA